MSVCAFLSLLPLLYVSPVQSRLSVSPLCLPSIWSPSSLCVCHPYFCPCRRTDSPPVSLSACPPAWLSVRAPPYTNPHLCFSLCLHSRLSSCLRVASLRVPVPLSVRPPLPPSSRPSICVYPCCIIYFCQYFALGAFVTSVVPSATPNLHIDWYHKQLSLVGMGWLYNTYIEEQDASVSYTKSICRSMFSPLYRQRCR